MTSFLCWYVAHSKTEAVITAVKDEIRLRKLVLIKAMAGKMEFSATAENCVMETTESEEKRLRKVVSEVMEQRSLGLRRNRFNYLPCQ